jgi:hypothetical protein
LVIIINCPSFIIPTSTPEYIEMKDWIFWSNRADIRNDHWIWLRLWLSWGEIRDILCWNITSGAYSVESKSSSRRKGEKVIPVPRICPAAFRACINGPPI